jgi:hypothetical protein
LSKAIGNPVTNVSEEIATLENRIVRGVPILSDHLLDCFECPLQHFLHGIGYHLCIFLRSKKLLIVLKIIEDSSSNYAPSRLTTYKPLKPVRQSL